MSPDNQSYFKVRMEGEPKRLLRDIKKEKAVAPSKRALFYLRLKEEPIQLLNEFVSKKGRMPSHAKGNVTERALARKVGKEGKQEFLYFLCLTDKAKKTYRRTQTENGRLPFKFERERELKKFVARKKRMPKQSSKNLKEKRLGQWVNQKGGQAGVKALLKIRI